MGDEKKYDDTNKGTLFKAQERPTENHPHYTGAINIDGADYWLSAWIKESKAGNKFMSLAAKPKFAQAAKAAPKRAADDDDGDGIPF